MHTLLYIVMEKMNFHTVSRSKKKKKKKKRCRFGASGQLDIRASDVQMKISRCVYEKRKSTNSMYTSFITASYAISAQIIYQISANQR